MKVAVGSQNPTKLEAVTLAFNKLWPDLDWNIVGIKVSSEVADQPMKFEESILGARNRAQQAIEITKADYGVGIEGGLQKIGDKYYEFGWTVVHDQKGVEGIGSTFGVQIPAQIMALIEQGQELGHAIDVVFKGTNLRQAEGFFGRMTNNAITRAVGHRDGVISALARFLHPELF